MGILQQPFCQGLLRWQIDAEQAHLAGLQTGPCKVGVSKAEGEAGIVIESIFKTIFKISKLMIRNILN